MHNGDEPVKVGGEKGQVADCYIWSEIYYLDSATNFREHLPVNSKSPHSKGLTEPLVMLDDACSLWDGWWRSAVIILTTLAVIILAIVKWCY